MGLENHGSSDTSSDNSRAHLSSNGKHSRGSASRRARRNRGGVGSRVGGIGSSVGGSVGGSIGRAAGGGGGRGGGAVTTAAAAAATARWVVWGTSAGVKVTAVGFLVGRAFRLCAGVLGVGCNALLEAQLAEEGGNGVEIVLETWRGAVGADTIEGQRGLHKG